MPVSTPVATVVPFEIDPTPPPHAASFFFWWQEGRQAGV